METTGRSSAEILTDNGMDLLAAGNPAQAAQQFRAAITANERCLEAHHGLIRALRDSNQTAQSIAAALALIGLDPDDPLAHTALSISLQVAGRIPEAEAAAARARILEWKQALQSPPGKNS